MEWIQSVIDYISAIFNGVVYLAESVLNFIRWIPSILKLTAGGGFITLLPASLVGVAIVVVAIYIIRIIVGGDNG